MTMGKGEMIMVAQSRAPRRRRERDERSERRRRRRERDEEPGGAARGAVGPGRSSRRRSGVVVPVLREDCVKDCGVFAVVREAYVVPLDRPFARRVRESKVRVDDRRRKSFLGDGVAALVPSSGEEPTSPRHRAGVASMAWRSTRRFSSNAP